MVAGTTSAGSESDSTVDGNAFEASLQDVETEVFDQTTLCMDFTRMSITGAFTRVCMYPTPPPLLTLHRRNTTNRIPKSAVVIPYMACVVRLEGPQGSAARAPSEYAGKHAPLRVAITPTFSQSFSRTRFRQDYRVHSTRLRGLVVTKRRGFEWRRHAHSEPCHCPASRYHDACAPRLGCLFRHFADAFRQPQANRERSLFIVEHSIALLFRM